MDTASFFEELASIKQAGIDPWWIPVGISTGLGAYGYLKNRPREDGRSGPEQQSLQNLPEAGVQNGDSLDALKEHRKNVAAAERAGGTLGITGASLVGWGGKELLKRRNRVTDKGYSTSPETAEALYRSTLPPDAGEILRNDTTWGARRGDNSAVLYFDDAGREQAQHIPPGGYSGALGKDKEILNLTRRKIPGAVIAHGMEHGATLLPGKANPHVAAHELGHAAFTLKPYAKLFRKAGTPVGIASAIGADMMASRADPDSAAAKAAPAVAALGLVPMLGEEAYASIKGLQGMRKAGLTGELLRHGAAQGSRALGAYAMKYGLPIVASPYIIRKVRQHRIAQREKAGLETTKDLDKQISASQEG